MAQNGTRYRQVAYANIESFLEKQNNEDEASPIVLITENYPIAGYDHDVDKQAEIVMKFVEKFADRVIVIALRSVYELQKFKGLKNYVCSFSSRPVSVQVMADLLTNKN